MLLQKVAARDAVYPPLASPLWPVPHGQYLLCEGPGGGQMAMSEMHRRIGWELARTCHRKCEPWKTGGDCARGPLGDPPQPEGSAKAALEKQPVIGKQEPTG